MGTSLAELVLVLAAFYLVYRLLSPLRRRLESLLLRWLAPERAKILDAETVPDGAEKKGNK